MNGFITEFLFVVFALVLVSIFAWLVLRAMKAMNPGKYKNGKIETLASIPVGSRERILVIKHRNTEYMLGITAENISLLDKYPAKEDSSTLAQTLHEESEIS